MKNFVKKITFGIFLLASFFLNAHEVSAADPGMKSSESMIYTGNQVITGKIYNPSPSNTPANINIFAIKVNGNYEKIGNFEWKVGEFGIPVTASDPSFNTYDRITFTYYKNGVSGETGEEGFLVNNKHLNPGNGVITTGNGGGGQTGDDMEEWLLMQQRDIDNVSFDAKTGTLFFEIVSTRGNGEKELIVRFPEEKELGVLKDNNNDFMRTWRIPYTPGKYSFKIPEGSRYVLDTTEKYSFIRKKDPIGNFDEKFYWLSFEFVGRPLTNTNQILYEEPYYIDDIVKGSAGGGQTSNVTVDFPGWASSENLPGWVTGNYCKKVSKEEYYPCLQSSGSITRTPASAPLHMILRASSTGEKKLLKTYPGGASSFNINALSPEEANGYGSLNADTIYEVFFASDEAGNNPVNYGSSTNPLKSLGKIPAPSDNAVSVTKAEIKTTSEGKKYFEVSGVVNKKIKDTMINVIVRKTTVTSGGELLGQIPYSQDFTFTLPSAQTLESLTSLEDGSYNLIFSRTVPPGIPEDFQTYPLPVVGAGTGTETDGGNGSAGTGGGGITPYISPDQQDVLDKGIVPVSCGSSYTDPSTGKLKHKLCGFPQLIEMIDRAIKFIFVLMLPITAIVFAYAGFLFLTSGGNSGKRDAAKKAMTSAIIGIIIILAAFLIVRTLLLALGVQPADWVFLNI